MSQRLKVLVSAYACEPGKGSEPGIGWNWVKQIARFCEIWVITRANNRQPIERVLRKKQMSNVHWVYFDLPWWARFWKRGQRGLHLYYYLWQIGVYFIGRRLHQQISFDLVHHVTFGNYWMPTFLALLPMIFVWGPVGGGESSPGSFYRDFGLRGQIYEGLRDMVRWLAEKDPFVRVTARRASIALATTPETAERLRRLGTAHREVFSGAGLPAEEWTKLQTIQVHNSTPFRLISNGRLLHWKGFHLSLKAFAQFQEGFPASEYWIVGDGPERTQLERLARQLGIAENICFFGALPRARVLELLTDCDVLVHPSLHDSSGWSCLEAMAAGRPVICLDLGGPALQVTEKTGIKVPAISPEQVVNDLAEAMSSLARDPDLRKRLGQTARRRVKEYFDWNKKREWMNELYQKAFGQRCQ